ncbi:hypothetical protein [Bacillus sp. UNC437CL72CviS29]|uniref:hypothetical protein n=1 Tax=Bacillus sp. UNC437CL72CviS29 TaxID=1340430 RepID=UPI00068FB147|nr:hypothetical protein [Bacillus sp. UNC437CL72CviS29]
MPVLKCDYINYPEKLEALYSLGIQLKLLGATLAIFEDDREISLEIVENQIESHKKILKRYNGDGKINGRSVTRGSDVIDNVTNAKIILKKEKW